jgi:hypothetical protein
MWVALRLLESLKTLKSLRPRSVSSFPLSALSDSNLPPKRLLQQRLEQELCLPLLDVQPLEFVERSLLNPRHMPPTRVDVERRISMHCRISKSHKQTQPRKSAMWKSSYIRRRATG